MNTRHKARTEENSPFVPSHGPSKVRVALDRTAILKELGISPSKSALSELKQTHPSRVNVSSPPLELIVA